MSFTFYAISMVLATVAAITYALYLGGINLMGDMTLHGVVAELCLSLTVRGYCLGQLPGYQLEKGHWTVRDDR